MTKPILESVPNFSCGRDQRVLDAIANAMSGISGVHLLDYSGDYDHNRSVFTLVGYLDPLFDALEAALAVALKQIDLRHHVGVHPRLGACDVLPLIPIKDADLADTAAFAVLLAERLNHYLGIPSYLYGAAATREDRQNLADVRRGGFEHLPQRIQDGDLPDFGTTYHPSFGAVALGARDILVAYNINLLDADLDLAKDIAKKIRTAGGGLPQLKALGLRLEKEDKIQVSMNLTDYRVTGMKTVFDLVSFLAAAAGARVEESELIGLTPLAALEGATAEYLKLKDFSDDRILEKRIEKLFG